MTATDDFARFAAAWRSAFDALGEGLAEALAALNRALADTVDEAGGPRQVVHGPPVRRHRAPRDHASNTAMAARSRAVATTQRNALRRR
ncbi:hypothetical protein [Glycomyces paridis]|uniref:Uncharacterized protein n=1 Tax=Glycomyces paridis TaxID=2126555 RepID=A0A4S8PE79_9ACTN|nr:hypothetical protein [Glycomyces paridis]THV27925.1 hypothetical protein E9998_13110 [Glycomyces paridis]